MAPLQPQDRGRLARTPTAALNARETWLWGLHNVGEIVHTGLSRDQPVPRRSKRKSLHQTQGGPTNGTRSKELVDEFASFGLHDVSAEAWFLALLGVMAFRHCTIRCALR